MNIIDFEPFSLAWNADQAVIRINGTNVAVDSRTIRALVETFAVTMGADLGAKAGDAVEVSFSYQVGGVA